MRTITHRELRNNSSRILAEVRSGQIIEVTNHGEVAAVLVPPWSTTWERLVAAGKVRMPSERQVDLRAIKRSQSQDSTAEIIRDLRGDR
ncbi:MAG: type II toxin-antitoxin system Phd/YefM family antitoxin [Acidimicrobiales bacterium]